jgi:hypothetical protein
MPLVHGPEVEAVVRISPPGISWLQRNDCALSSDPWVGDSREWLIGTEAGVWHISVPYTPTLCLAHVFISPFCVGSTVFPGKNLGGCG